MPKSGYPGISNDNDRWRFRVTVDGVCKTIKSSRDLDKLIEFADKWKLDKTTPINWNSSGYKGISKSPSKSYKQGFRWRFIYKGKSIKTSVDLDKLIEFADKWKLDNA